MSVFKNTKIKLKDLADRQVIEFHCLHREDHVRERTAGSMMASYPESMDLYLDQLERRCGCGIDGCRGRVFMIISGVERVGKFL